MILNFLNKKVLILKLLLLILLIILIKNYFDKNKIFEILINLNYFFYFFLIIPISLIIILMSVKWYLITNNKKNLIGFKDCYKTILLGFNASFLSSSSIAMDITKAYNEKKRNGIQKSIYLVLYDKFVTIFFKIFFIILVYNVINFLTLKNNFYFILIFSIFFVFFFRFFFFRFFLEKFYNFFKKEFLKNFFKLFLEKEKLFNKLFLLNALIQFLIIFIYFYSFLLFGDNINFIKISLAVPIVEIMSQAQVIIPGFKEAITVYVFSFLDLDLNKILIVAIVIKFTEIITALLLLVINSILKKMKHCY